MAPAVVQLEAQLWILQSRKQTREIPGHENGIISGSRPLAPSWIMKRAPVGERLIVFPRFKTSRFQCHRGFKRSHFDVEISQADIFAVNGEFEDFETT